MAWGEVKYCGDVGSMWGKIVYFGMILGIRGVKCSNGEGEVKNGLGDEVEY